MANKKKADSSVGYVEPGMTLIIGVKEGEWQELKNYREESVLYQIGTSLIMFSASLFVTLLASDIQSVYRKYAIIAILFLSLGGGIMTLFFWYKELKKKESVITRVEGRAKEQYGDQISL